MNLIVYMKINFYKGPHVSQFMAPVWFGFFFGVEPFVRKKKPSHSWSSSQHCSE